MRLTCPAPTMVGCEHPIGPPTLPEGVFLTWERHRRTRGLAARLGLSLREIQVPGSRLRRYLPQIARTCSEIRRSDWSLVFVQNPSLALTILVLGWRSIARKKWVVVMDAHNEAVVPAIYAWRAVRLLARWAVRQADFTIVTNRFLGERVLALGGRPLVLPDPLPEIAPAPAPTLGGDAPIRLLVIATYAPDEPIEAILESARRLVGHAEFEFTGNYRKLEPSVIAAAPANVKFLGFLQDDDYWDRMGEAHAVVDLTLLDDCLVCGAYEAVALGRPLLLSDTRALRDYFRMGAVYCEAEPSAIVSAVRRLQIDYSRLSKEAVSLRTLLEAEWIGQAAGVVSQVRTDRASGCATVT